MELIIWMVEALHRSQMSVSVCWRHSMIDDRAIHWWYQVTWPIPCPLLWTLPAKEQARSSRWVVIPSLIRKSWPFFTKAALDDAFTAPEQFPEPVLHVNHAPVAPQPTISQTASGTDAEQGSSSGVDDAWKEEYEAQLQTWRAQSAEQRERAEKERLRWEAVRAQEKDEAERRKSAGQENWERVDASASNVLSTPASSHDVRVFQISYNHHLTDLDYSFSTPENLRLRRELQMIYKNGKMCLPILLLPPSSYLSPHLLSLPNHLKKRPFQSPYPSLIHPCLRVRGYLRSRPLWPWISFFLS